MKTDRFIVYYYKNKLDGKIYVGRTNNPTRRFRQHLAGEYKTEDNFFHKAITELCLNNDFEAFCNVFEMGVLYEETCNHEDRFEVSKRIDEIEAKYIKELNSLWPNGYNNKAFSHTKMFNLRKDQIEKKLENNKCNVHKERPSKVLLPECFDTRLSKEEKGKRVKERLHKFYNSEEQLKIRAEKKQRTLERYKQEREKRKEERKLYKKSLEGQRRSQEFKEAARKRRIEYNKSEAHRLVAIESNKNRWKNGCPEETREKMRLSGGKAKGKIWVSKGTETKMIHKEDLEKYIEMGYSKGRNFVPHNKKI